MIEVMKPSSRYSLVRLFPISSSRSAPTGTVFYDFYMKSSSRYSLVRLFPTSSSKSVLNPAFFKIFKLKSSSRSVVCTFCRPHLPKVIRAPQFFTINLFNPVFTRSRPVTLPNYAMMSWHDDVVDIMVILR